MDRLDAIRLYLRVVEAGSFAAAARDAGVGQPAVSKQIAALELRYGARLLHRTSRSLAVTEVGQVFYEAGVRLLDEMEAAEGLVRRAQSAPSGLVRVTTAPAFGRLRLLPHLPAFFRQYPEISVELNVSDRTINLVEEGVDLAVHVGPIADSSMAARRIATSRVVTVAAPAYLAERGEPMSPSELEHHSCIVFAPRHEPRPWTFQGKSGPISHAPRGVFRTADAEQIRAAALAGLGVAHAPDWLFEGDVAAGSVRRILEAYEPEPLAISTIHPSGRRLPAKVKAFIDFLAEVLPAER